MMLMRRLVQFKRADALATTALSTGFQGRMLRTFSVLSALAIVETTADVVRKKEFVPVTNAHLDSSIGLLQIILLVMASFVMTWTEIHAADLWHAAILWCCLRAMLTNWMLI
jgi:hypothetical protein